MRDTRPIVVGLDAFCGAGGSTRGYMMAADRLGVRLIMLGIDNRPQPRYNLSGGLGFIQGNIFDWLANRSFMSQFDFINASPPCQIFSQTKHLGNNAGKEDLLTPLRPWMEVYNDRPWIIENVEKCDLLEDPLVLCGSMFEGLVGYNERRQLRRHRKFEFTGMETPPALDCQHNGFRPVGVYGTPGAKLPGGGEVARNLDEGGKLLGINWMKWPELKEAIPPAYTDYIGEHVLKAVLAA